MAALKKKVTDWNSRGCHPLALEGETSGSYDTGAAKFRSMRGNLKVYEIGLSSDCLEVWRSALCACRSSSGDMSAPLIGLERRPIVDGNLFRFQSNSHLGEPCGPLHGQIPTDLAATSKGELCGGRATAEDSKPNCRVFLNVKLR